MLSRLETEFELSDFLDEDLEVMQVRSDLQSSYTSANWRPVTVLLEPLEGATTSPMMRNSSKPWRRCTMRSSKHLMWWVQGGCAFL